MQTPLPTPAMLELASAIRRSVGGLARRLRSERADTGISLTKLSVLGRLYRRGSTSARELASLERIQPQSLTRVLADLDKAGFISRRADERDGRRILIDITGSGAATLVEDMRRRDAWLAQALSSEVSATEQEFLRLASRLLERLAETTGRSEDAAKARLAAASAAATS
jgi:DNA-binding MarR family transcriptional regulator